MGGGQARDHRGLSAPPRKQSSEMQIPPREKIKDKVTRLWIAALAPMPTVVDLSPSSASPVVVTVERQRAPGNETLLGWGASPKKWRRKRNERTKQLCQTVTELSSKMFCQQDKYHSLLIDFFYNSINPALYCRGSLCGCGEYCIKGVCDTFMGADKLPTPQ